MQIQFNQVNFNANIPKERILQLQSSGKKYKEIVKELGVSETTYNSLCAEYDIVSEMQKLKQHIASITEERFRSLVDKFPVKEVCKKLQISERTYSRLIDKFKIITKRKMEKLRAQAITKEQLQELVDSGLTKKEICALLGINQPLFYVLLKRHNIKYNYQHHHREKNIPGEVLERVQKISKTVKEAADKLGITVATYHEKAKNAGVKTIYRDAIDKLNSISPGEFQEAVDKMPVKEVCKKFGITLSNYLTLIRRHNTQTPQRIAMERIAGITKEDLLKDRAEGKMIKTICAERGIGLSTYRRIMKRN